MNAVIGLCFCGLNFSVLHTALVCVTKTISHNLGSSAVNLIRTQNLQWWNKIGCTDAASKDI